MTHCNHLPLIAAGLLLLLSACGTVEDAGSNYQDEASLMREFDAKGSNFRKLVEAGKYNEARSYFYDHKNSYFRTLHVAYGKPTTKELTALGEWHFQKAHREAVDTTMKQLVAITETGDPSSWPSRQATIINAENVDQRLQFDELLFISKTALDQKSALGTELERVKRLYKENRNPVFKSSFGDVLETGEFPASYPLNPFGIRDYQSSVAFQAAIFKRVSATATETERVKVVSRLSRLRKR